MPEGFHPTPPDATNSVRRVDVPAEVVAYADNLMLQLDAIVARYGFRDFRDARDTPDAERHARLEAVMELADLDRYRELIVGYREAVTKKKIPASDRDWKRRQSEARAAESVREAVEAMGAENVLGPDAAAATFGLDLESLDVPPVPFSRTELERARELGQFLVFRVSKAADGTPLSMAKMSEVLAPRFAREDKGTVLRNTDWCENDPFFRDEAPAAGWALVSRDVVPSTASKNFLQQTEELVRYLRNEAFKNAELPQKYLDAIAQFEAAKAGIAAIISTDWQKAAQMLEALDITPLTRQSPAEAAYDAMVTFDRTGVRHLPGIYTWTSRRSAGGRLVCVGRFVPAGLRVSGDVPGHSYASLGAAFARR